MLKAFFSSPHAGVRSRAYGGIVLLIVLLIAQNLVAVLFNIWNGIFLDAMAHAAERPAHEYWDAIKKIAMVAGCDILFGTAAGYVTAIYAIWWRKALTAHYLPLWQATSVRIEGASQRIQEDPIRLAGILEMVGLDVVRSLIALVTFVPLLWVLGEGIRSGPLSWHGSLIVLAAAMALVGIGVSVIVGKTLPSIITEQQVFEAAYRKHLVHGEEQRSLLEAGDGWRLLFKLVIENSQRMALSYYGFAVWATSYDKVMFLTPYIACGESLTAGWIQFAVTMQIVNAFGQVQGGFSVVLKNWTRLMELKSVWHRLSDFEADLLALQTKTETVVPHPALVHIVTTA